MKLNMKANESSPAKDKENQCLKLCSTAAAFAETVTKDGLTKTEIETETNISDEDVEVDLDVGSNNCMYDQVSDLHVSPSKSSNSNQGSVIKTVTNKSEEGDEANVDVGSKNGMYDEASRSHSSQGKNLEQISIKTSGTRLHQTETFEERAGKEVSGLENESSAEDVNMWYDQLLNDGEDEDDHYNRFYFESDHLALKDNKQ